MKRTLLSLEEAKLVAIDYYKKGVVEAKIDPFYDVIELYDSGLYCYVFRTAKSLLDFFTSVGFDEINGIDSKSYYGTCFLVNRIDGSIIDNVPIFIKHFDKLKGNKEKYIKSINAMNNNYKKINNFTLQHYFFRRLQLKYKNWIKI